MLTHDARRLAPVLLLAAALSPLFAACATDVTGAPIGTGQIVDSDPSPTPSGSPGSGSAEPAPPPSDDLPAAADGSDVTTCFDGTCEVALRAPVTIPFDPKTGLVSLTLTRVDEVDGAQLSGTAVGGGSVSVSVYADPGFTSTATVNGFTIVALATVDGIAVLRMSPPG